jgi:hypothetical protein
MLANAVLISPPVRLTIKGGISEYARKQPRIYVLDKDGAVREELKEIIRQVKEADVILNLGHTSFAEMIAVLEEAKRQGVRRVVCDHPFFLRLDLKQQLALVERGAFITGFAPQPRGAALSLASRATRPSAFRRRKFPESVP